MELTPMMKQYLEIHKQVPDAILLFRLGDFYEMFFDDAITASRVLSLVLTGRNCGLEDRAPMCGVPYHAASGYIAKLIKAGHKVAVCEQVENPSDAKGIVRREIVKIISPGTVTDEKLLDEKENNYLLCIYSNGISFCIAYIDVSTAEFKTCLLSGQDRDINLINEVEKISPKEILCNDVFLEENNKNNILQKHKNTIHILDNSFFQYENSVKIIKEHISISKLNKAEIFDSNEVSYIRCIGAVLLYLNNHHKQMIKYIKDIKKYTQDEYMILDTTSRRNLELIKNMTTMEKHGSLLWVLDKCDTAMGSRKLKEWIENPLKNQNKIVFRQNAVQELRDNIIQMNDLKEILSKIYDIKRIATRICNDNCSPKDMLLLQTSTLNLKNIKKILQMSKSDYLLILAESVDELYDIANLVENAIEESAPNQLKDGNVIKKGYDETIDELRNITQNSQKILAGIEEKEKEKTKIKNLKIKYNKVFGYYIEVSNANLNLVPENYIRKQTLANSERYFTEELKQLETDILSAEEKLLKRETEVFELVRQEIFGQIERILHTADAIAEIDVLTAFAYTAYIYSYCRPEMTDNGIIELVDSRHPVIELIEKDNEFIPNSCLINTTDRRMQIITGPNMSGKSTFIRQIAIITLMAQIGSFIPAKSAQISIVDRIFTRVGASDDLLSGRSTFMVEMSEVSHILKNATQKSLIILDEVGRGTSTFDGLSIAWAVCEYIASQDILGAKTLFATHYHELTELGSHDGIINLCIRAIEKDDGVIFLRKIEEGIVDKSYGIEVARLAGMPNNIILRARQILKILEKQDHISKNKIENIINTDISLNIPDEKNESLNKEAKEIIDTIKKLSINNISPIDAIMILNEMKNNLDKEKAVE
jgi:DNA mismatch repair protein MutS